MDAHIDIDSQPSQAPQASQSIKSVYGLSEDQIQGLSALRDLATRLNLHQLPEESKKALNGVLAQVLNLKVDQSNKASSTVPLSKASSFASPDSHFSAASQASSSSSAPLVEHSSHLLHYPQQPYASDNDYCGESEHQGFTDQENHFNDVNDEISSPDELDEEAQLSQASELKEEKVSYQALQNDHRVLIDTLYMIYPFNNQYKGTGVQCICGLSKDVQFKRRCLNHAMKGRLACFHHERIVQDLFHARTIQFINNMIHFIERSSSGMIHIQQPISSPLVVDQAERKTPSNHQHIHVHDSRPLESHPLPYSSSPSPYMFNPSQATQVYQMGQVQVNSHYEAMLDSFGLYAQFYNPNGDEGCKQIVHAKDGTRHCKNPARWVKRDGKNHHFMYCTRHCNILLRGSN